MGLLVVIIFSALVGWIASIIMSSGSNQNPLTYIITGIVGALLGSFLMNFFGHAGLTGLNSYSFIVALSGAVLLVLIVRILRHT